MNTSVGNKSVRPHAEKDELPLRRFLSAHRVASETACKDRIFDNGGNTEFSMSTWAITCDQMRLRPYLDGERYFGRLWRTQRRRISRRSRGRSTSTTRTARSRPARYA